MRYFDGFLNSAKGMSGCKNEMCLGMHPHKFLKILWLRLAKSAFLKGIYLMCLKVLFNIPYTTQL